MLSGWHIAVLVPARNEEDLLPRCLASIDRARRLLPPDVTSDVIVVADSSADRTFEIAEAALGDTGCAVAVKLGCVGAARVVAAQVALERYNASISKCWLANTDADCEVPVTWLLDQLKIAQQGIAAVAGIVDVDSFSEHPAKVRRLFRETYLIEEDGTHPHVHGANLGIRADAYLYAGGWAQLETAEDHDLWGRLGSSGFPRVSDANLQVITSGRKIGRAPSGFAGALAAHGIEVAI
jgi:glycosyltransferase involved in cell wall biosynthesis